MTDGKDTAAKIKPLLSKENAQNRPETIRRGQVLGVSAFREQIGKAVGPERIAKPGAEQQRDRAEKQAEKFSFHRAPLFGLRISRK